MMWQELQNDAEEMARKAGALLLKYFRGGLVVESKGTIDLVTDADRASEALIISAIEKKYPGDGILGEEGGSRFEGADRRWVIDPLDGTVNFAHGLGHFCVLIAAQVRDSGGEYETVAGATFDPCSDEMFLASKGGGATLNGSRIQVTQTQRLIESVMATGFGYDRLMTQPDNHAEFCRLSLLTRGVRRFGAAGLDLAHVACGRYDGYWEYWLNPWDMAPGLLLVEEAGGEVSSIGGGSVVPARGEVVASNGALHHILNKALVSARSAGVNSRDGLAEFLPQELAAKL
jgi:myo-inositol-1(or 4)-monophosphatase